MGEHDKEIFERLRAVELELAQLKSELRNDRMHNDSRWRDAKEKIDRLAKACFGNGDRCIGFDEVLRGLSAKVNTIIDNEKARRATTMLIIAALLGFLLDKLFETDGLLSIALRIFK